MTRTTTRLKAFLFRLVLFALLWWSLSEGRMLYPVPAAVFIILAALVSMHFVRPRSWNIRAGALPAFFLFFLLQAFLAGLDVARRALHPRLPLAPGVIPYQLSVLEHDFARVFFVWIVSLLPGTAAVSLEKNRVMIHVLDTHHDHSSSLLTMEHRINKLFRQ